MKFGNGVLVALIILFFMLGYKSYQEAKPQEKSQRIYLELKKHMPYYLEKRVGGFQIMMKGSTTKEKPPITEVYRRLEQLEQGWGKEFLKIKGNDLIVVDKNGTQVAKIPFHLDEEKIWVQQYFDIK